MLYLYHSDTHPIWEDIYISTQGTAFESFEAANFDLILLSQSYYPTILSGRAVKRPGDQYIRVLVNDIIADYLRPRLEGMLLDVSKGAIVPSSDGSSEAVHSFQFTWKDPDSVVANHSIVFDAFADWSYNRAANYYYRTNYEAYFRSAPIDGKVDPRQFLLLTTLVGTRLQIDGGGTVTISSGADANAPKTWYCRPGTEGMAAGVKQSFTLTFPSTPFDGTEYQSSRVHYTVVPQCARYCLYYVNALGGWDSFLIRGTVKERDAITRTEYERRAPSSLFVGNVQKRGREVLTLTATRALEMHTGWLTDDEASRMYHLTESVSVYVHDLETDIVYAAVMVNSTHEEKSYKKNGNRLVSYQLDVELAVPIERR